MPFLKTFIYLGLAPWHSKLKPVPAVSVFHMGSSLKLSNSTSNPPPCYCPEEAARKGVSPWASAPTWGTLKNILAPGFRQAQLWPLWPLKSRVTERGTRQSESLIHSLNGCMVGTGLG